MTDRLRELLHDEADRLVVPRPSGAAVLTRGRGLRRRRRLTEGVAALAVLVAVAGGALALTGGDDAHHARAVDPAGDTAAPEGADFAIGGTVFVDDARTSADLGDVFVISLDQTSAGVLVRHVGSADLIGRAAQQFSLVRPDGTVSDLGAVIDRPGPDGQSHDTTFDTDPAQPYLAYTEEAGDTVHLLVRDVDTDRQVADVALPGARTEVLQQVGIDGDEVYVGTGDTVRVVDWRTGAVEVSTALTQYLDTVSGGHAMVTDGKGGALVVDTTTGAVLVPAPPKTADVQFHALSPDGTHAVYSTRAQGETSFDAYDVATGRRVTVAGSARAQGWTADGQLFTVSRDDVLTRCSPDTGACTTISLDLPVHPGREGDMSAVLQPSGRIH